MTTTRAGLFRFLDDLGIEHSTMEHREVFTVEDGADITARLPGGHSKNLFLKDKKGALILISALASTNISLNQLHKTLGCARLSFARAKRMHEVLGVTPGSVTAFALINDRPPQVRFILDAALMAFDIVNFHPLKNNATTAITRQNLVVFAKATGHDPEIIDFTAMNATTVAP